MGGESHQEQTQTSQTQPWAAAQPSLTGILGQLNPLIANSGLSPTSSGALDQLQQNAAGGNPFSGQITDYATRLLNGGGANDQAGAVGQNLTDLQGRLGQYADPNYSSLNNPELKAALQQVRDDVGNSINGQFAAAGRDFSGANQMAYGRGVTAAQAPLILDQFNKDQAIRQGSAQSLYDAGNQSSGLLAGLNQQDLTNRGAGVNASQDALAAQNYGPSTTLQLDQMRQSIPAQTLGLLAQIGIPIAGLGSQSTGTSTGTSQMSGAQQFQTIASGIGSLGNLWNRRS